MSTPSLFGALRSIYAAVIATAELVPATVTVAKTNVDSLQHLSDAGNIWCADVKSTQEYEHKTRVLELETKFKSLEAKSVTKLKAA